MSHVYLPFLVNYQYAGEVPVSSHRLRPPFLNGGPVVGDYFDPISGRHFVVARPEAQPELWAAYIEGALDSYRQHDVQTAIEFGRVRDGRCTSMFFAAVECDGRVIGGMRVQGPYTDADQAHALAEWAGRDGSAQIRREVQSRLAEGVIEIKAVWVDHDAPHRHELSSALSRVFVHAMDLMRVRHAMCTAASHAMLRWQTSGGVVSRAVPPVPYPDDRYQTHLMWWDRLEVGGLVDSEQLISIIAESEQLFGAAPVPTLCSVA